MVGGGAVGTRKVQTLLNCGARVTVVSPKVTESLQEIVKTDNVTLWQRCYQTTDLDGMFMVIGATDDASLNQRIHSDADARQMLCNIADQPRLCNFILPAVVQRGDLILAVSTSGKSPAFAKTLRKKLEHEFGEEYAQFLQLMGAVREKLLSRAHAPEAHKPLFQKLIAGNLLDMIRRRDIKAVDRLLHEILGKGYQYEALLGKGKNTTVDTGK